MGAELIKWRRYFSIEDSVNVAFYFSSRILIGNLNWNKVEVCVKHTLDKYVGAEWFFVNHGLLPRLFTKVPSEAQQKHFISLITHRKSQSWRQEIDIFVALVLAFSEGLLASTPKEGHACLSSKFRVDLLSNTTEVIEVDDNNDNGDDSNDEFYDVE